MEHPSGEQERMAPGDGCAARTLVSSVGDLKRIFSSLSVYNYRLFFLGQAVSVTGTWMQTIAQAWLVLSLTNSPAALGTVTALRFLPVTALALVGGVLADRLPKRRLLLLTQSLSAIQALLLAVLVFTGAIHVWHVYLLALFLGLANAFDAPVRQSFLMELVGREQLPNAVALNSSLVNVARMLGPALGGFMVGALGVGGAFLINAFSFLATILALVLMQRSEYHAAPSPAALPLWSGITEGLGYAMRTPQVLFVLTLVAPIAVFGYNFQLLLPLVARFLLGGDALVLGMLTSTVGFGAVLAALATAYSPRASDRMLLGSALVFSIMLVFVGVSASYPFTVASLAVLGGAGVVLRVGSSVRLQLSVPWELRGRMMSLYFLLFAGSTPVGSLLIGVAASTLGVRVSVVLAGVACAPGVIAAWLYSYKTPNSVSWEGAEDDGHASHPSM